MQSSSDLDEVEVEFSRPTGVGLGIKIAAYVSETEGTLLAKVDCVCAGFGPNFKIPRCFVYFVFFPSSPLPPPSLSLSLIEDKGIYIAMVNPTGPAGMTGLIKEGDKIMCVNGKLLKGLSNVEAAGTLRACGSTVRLVVGRKKRSESMLTEEEEMEEKPIKTVQPTLSHSGSSGRVGVTSQLKEEKERSTGQEEAGHVYEEGTLGWLFCVIDPMDSRKELDGTCLYEISVLSLKMLT